MGVWGLQAPAGSRGRAPGLPSQSGFTLLELLIAIALLSLLTAVAYAGVQFGTLSWRRAEQHQANAADQVAVARVLRQAIGGAYPRFATASFADRSVAFTGGHEALALVAPLPAAIQAGIMAQQRFFVADSDNGPLLMLGWRLDLPAADGGVLPEHFARLAAVRAVRFAYFGRPKPGDDAAWFDEWSGMPALPELVRVRLWRADTDAPPWLDVMAETRTTTSTACVYDPSELNCRRIR